MKMMIAQQRSLKVQNGRGSGCELRLVYEPSRRQDSGCMTVTSFLIFTFVQKGTVVTLVRFKNRRAQSTPLTDEAAYWLDFPFKDPAQTAEMKHT